MFSDIYYTMTHFKYILHIKNISNHTLKKEHYIKFESQRYRIYIRAIHFFRMCQEAFIRQTEFNGDFHGNIQLH